MNPNYARVAGRAAHRCEYCQAPEAIFNFPFEVEHIIPSGHGGNDEESNLALSCRSCNLFKSDRLIAPDPQTGNMISLFHPRQHRWEEHFEAHQATGMLHGLTPMGRATVECLQMNRSIHRAARQQWMKLRLFPK